MTRTCGVFRPSFATRIYLTKVWSIELCTFVSVQSFSLTITMATRNPTHSLFRFLLVSNSLDLIIDVLLKLWTAVVGKIGTFLFELVSLLLCRSGFVPPYALKEILSALASDEPEVKKRAYYWTFVIFIAHLSFAQADLFQSWHTRRCYERTRGQLFCIMHFKSLKRQDITGQVNPEGETSNANLGKTLNLMQSVFRNLYSRNVQIFTF